MRRIERELTGLDDTRALARGLARVLRPGDVVLLDGELGAGKTTLVRSIVGAIGGDESMVSSPTFVVVNEYPLPVKDPGPAPLTLVHADAYRLGGADDLDALGWDRLVGDGSITLVEWGERIADAAPDAARVLIEATGETSRRVTIEAPDAWSDRPGLSALAGGAGDGVAGKTRRATTCPVTGKRVDAASPTWPFADERARMADLYRWMSGGYAITRPIEQADLEQGE